MAMTAVVAAEAEAVGDGGAHRLRHPLLGHVVQVAGRVRLVEVGRRRVELLVERLGHDHRLRPAGAAEQVADHRLGRRYLEPVGVLAEHALDGGGLDRVVERGGGAVGVDVVHLVRRQAGGTDRHAHGRLRAQPFGVGGGEVKRVAGGAVAGQLGVGPGPAGGGVLGRFQHQDAGPFAENEAVAILVERPAGVLGIVVEAGRQRLQVAEPRERDRRDQRLRPAGHHHVAHPRADAAQGAADGVGGRGAGRGDHQRGTGEPELHRDLADRGGCP